MEKIKQRVQSIPREVLNWIERTFQPFYRDQATAYLSESVDHADLEARIKLLKYRGML